MGSTNCRPLNASRPWTYLLAYPQIETENMNLSATRDSMPGGWRHPERGGWRHSERAIQDKRKPITPV